MKRESQYVQVARLAYQLAKRSLRKYRHRNSPHTYSQPQVAACTLLVFYLNKSYRDGEEWLLASERVCQVLELQGGVPDHSTLNRMYHRLNRVRLLRLLRYLLEQQAPREAVIALDSTGYRPSQASAYYQTRTGRRYRDWFKGAYAVGTESQLTLAVRESHGGSANDACFLLPLKRGARPYVKHNGLTLADAGFDCQAVSDRDLIPPIRRAGKLVAPERKARADLVSQARLDGLFGQRWKTETVHSVIKRKFGGTVRSRALRAQRREPILKAVLYNIHR